MQVQSTFDQYRDGGWVHYSKLPQLTVNPKQFHQDPAGIYLFPETFETEGGWHRYPHRIHVRLKPNLKVLDISTLQFDQINDLLERLGFQDLSRQEFLNPDPTPRDYRKRFWETLRQRFMSEPGHFNKIFRRLGYDAIFDDDRVIHSAEVQLIVLNPRKVEVVSIENQKTSGFDEINQVLDLVAKKLGSLGKVEIKRPQKVKSWGVQNLQGSCTVTDQDQYIRVQVEPWFVQKDDQVPEALSVTIKDSGNQDRTYSVSLHFRNFQAELNKLFDPKEDLMKRVRKIFGKETVSQLYPILVPQEPGVPWPGGYDNFSGPPFGKVDYETHPMYGDPEVYLHAPSAPLKEFLRDVTPIISAATQTPYVTVKEDTIEVLIEGKGHLTGQLLSDYEYWFEYQDQKEMELPYQSIALLEHLEVNPESRREGTGTELVKAFIQTVKKFGAEAIFLNASPYGYEKVSLNALKAFYQSLGFKVWRQEGMNSIVMFMEISAQKSSADYETTDTVGLKPTEWTAGPEAPARLAKDPWGSNMGFTASTPNQTLGKNLDGYELQILPANDFKSKYPEYLEQNQTLNSFFKNPNPRFPVTEVAFCLDTEGLVCGHVAYSESLFDPFLYPLDAEILPEHRRRGLASALYEKAEDWTGKTFEPAADQSEDAKKFWAQPNRSFGKTVKPKKPSAKKGKLEFTSYAEGDEIPQNFVKLIPKTDALHDYINRDDEPIQLRLTVSIDGAPAGVGTLEHPSIHGYDLGDTTIVQVFLAPKFRGLGVGNNLMDALKEELETSYWAGYVHHSPGFNQLAKKYGVRDLDEVSQYAEDDPNWQADGQYDEEAQHTEASVSLSASERLTIARETLDEDSDLMQFYYLADREAWEEGHMDYLKDEWQYMKEEFREEVPAQLKAEGYDESYWTKRGKIDWDEVGDYWIRMRLKDLQEEAPTTQTYFEKAQIIQNPTLIRFTKYPEGVLENGFEGHEPENLGLTVWGQRPGNGDLAFAFEKKDLKKISDWEQMVSKYGEHIFEFTVPYAVRAYHLTDGEWQTVFDVNQVQDLKVIELPKPSRRQQMNKLKKEIESMGLSEMLSLQEKLNADDADYPQSVYDAFNKRVPIVKRQHQEMRKLLQREKAQ